MAPCNCTTPLACNPCIYSIMYRSSLRLHIHHTSLAMKYSTPQSQTSLGHTYDLLSQPSFTPILYSCSRPICLPMANHCREGARAIEAYLSKNTDNNIWAANYKQHTCCWTASGCAFSLLILEKGSCPHNRFTATNIMKTQPAGRRHRCTERLPLDHLYTTQSGNRGKP